MNNKGLTVLISITLALVCVLVGINMINDGVKISENKENDIVSVYGRGIVFLEPDVAYLSLGYENIDMDPKAAQAENAATMVKVIDAIKNAGIPIEDIQTSNYNVNQEFKNHGSEKTFVGYKVINYINVKVDEVERVNEIINISINAGANAFFGIEFSVIDRQQAYLDAMEIALERAKEKAQIYAQKEGRNISDVLSIDEGSAPSLSRSPYNNVSLSYARDASGALEGAIATGQVEIIATVTVVYALD